MVVIQLAESEENKQHRLLRARRGLGEFIAQTAFADAYARVLRDFPEITSEDARLECASTLALNALPEATKYLNAYDTHGSKIEA